MDRGYQANDQYRARITKASGHVFFAKATHETEIHSEIAKAERKGCTCGRIERYDRRKGTWTLMLMPQEQIIVD